jgi:small-conductance mechanosensitive channel
MDATAWMTPALVPWATSLTVLGATVALGLAVEWLVMARLRRWAAATPWRGDDLVVNAVRGLPILWSVLLGLHLAAGAAPMHDEALRAVRSAIAVAWIFSATLVAGRALVGLWRLGDSASGGAGATLIPVVIRVAVVITGTLVALQTLGISITPMLTALGVGGLAVALALQDTLANLFAGLHIVASRKVRVGDTIRLDTGDEGEVTDITWRNTTIRTGADNQVLVPNIKLSQAVVTNFSMPDTDLILGVDVGIAYGSDLDLVERTALAAIAAVQAAHPAAVADRPAAVRFTAFADSAITCRVALWVRSYQDQGLLRHALIKRLHMDFSAAAIVIPYPTRTVIGAPA